MKTNKSHKNIPSDWQQIKLGDVLSVGSGKDYKHLEVGDIPVFGTGGYMLSVNKPLYSGETVFIGRKGTIDKPFYFKGDFWTVDTLFYTHKFKNTTARYINNVFQKIDWKSYNEASGVPSLSKTTIEKIKISLPPLPEQNRIVSVLETWDNAIEKLSEKIEVKKQIKKGLMQDLLTGNKRLKSFSEEWKSVKLGNISTIKKGQQLNKEHMIEGGKYPALNGGIEASGFTDKYNTDENVITISEGGNSCGYVNFSIEKFWCGGHCYAVSPDENMNNIFLYQILKMKQEKIMSLRVGSGLPNIQLKSLNSFKFDIPKSKEEQSAIAQILTTADKEINKLENKLKILKEQKRYLLNNLVTGTIRTPDPAK